MDVDISGIDDITTCQVCVKILALFKVPFKSKVELDLGKVSEVLTTGCPHADWVRDVEYRLGPVPRYRNRKLKVYKDQSSTAIALGVRYRTHNISRFWNTTHNMELVFRENHPEHRGRSKVLDPEWVDVNTMASWYTDCVKEHGIECENLELIRDIEPVNPDWLIDIVQSRLVPAKHSTEKYISLSYTWGQASNLRTTTLIIDDLLRPEALSRENKFGRLIPETIRNAMEITKLLGERYLWVDSLCIVQDDLTALNHSLRKMHMIFANSSVCIVAMAGQDANFGLRGMNKVSAPRSAGQYFIDLAEGERLSGILPDASPGAGRSYGERAWTFQEFMFAKRRLVFDKGCVRWHATVLDGAKS